MVMCQTGVTSSTTNLFDIAKWFATAFIWDVLIQENHLVGQLFVKLMENMNCQSQIWFGG